MNNGLEEALRIAQLGDLPLAIDETYKKHWLKAIVKIQRSNGETGYCLAVNDGNNKPRIIRDFNPTGIIIRILSIHPYEETERNIMPRFANDEQVVKYLCKNGFKRDEIVYLLKTEGKTDEQVNADKEILKSYIMQVANKQVQIKLESDEQARTLAAMANPELKEKRIKEKKYGRKATTRKAKGSKGED